MKLNYFKNMCRNKDTKEKLAWKMLYLFYFMFEVSLFHFYKPLSNLVHSFTNAEMNK